ncbi:MAG TPA: OmpH family outer membrane protein [Acetobacteraceae bacterium]|nr:OmpH family outer membrane protein [Acetobacteraceae bacterium]
MLSRKTAVGIIAAVSILLFQPLAAQQSQDYFIPPKAGAAPAAPPGQRAPAARQPAAQPAPRPTAEAAPQDTGGAPEQEPPLPQIPMPPVPELAALPKVPPPKQAIVGVIGVPEVMRASTAAQQIDKVIGERRQKLNEDAQKEQAAWREMQQALATHRSTMSPEQIRTKERELQDRVTSAQRQFRERNRVIQEAAQVALNQIQAALIAVIRQVAESHDMNLVLHRQQVALNIAEFDITDQVTKELNRILPAVTIPADGVSPLAQGPIPPPIVPAAAASPATPPPTVNTGAPAAPAAPATQNKKP